MDVAESVDTDGHRGNTLTSKKNASMLLKPHQQPASLAATAGRLCLLFIVSLNAVSIVGRWKIRIKQTKLRGVAGRTSKGKGQPHHPHSGL